MPLTQIPNTMLDNVAGTGPAFRTTLSVAQTNRTSLSTVNLEAGASEFSGFLARAA